VSSPRAGREQNRPSPPASSSSHFTRGRGAAQGDEGEEGREEIVNQVLQQPVIQIALPIIITIIVAAWMNNKGIDGVHKRLDDICRRLDAIEARLLGIENRLGTLERKVDALEIKAWR
jgi:tetrahydromethanopterin S-methyltransferase subunit G